MLILCMRYEYDVIANEPTFQHTGVPTAASSDIAHCLCCLLYTSYLGNTIDNEWRIRNKQKVDLTLEKIGMGLSLIHI